ncbi:hypothetical protein VTN77DRAFT_5059 [Rasamsonia byssochlamydoides]|uniref:uncharacterized protein n=1 Tax=Rasamsonia byssochlamydoides TaxID=89139 RepID=UPI003743A9BE
MVYYVRFLKSPKIQNHKAGLVSVSALISITTDLGDAFLADDVTLHTSLYSPDTNTVLRRDSFLWQAGKRELLVSVGPVRLGRNPIVILGIGSVDTPSPGGALADSLLDPSTVPEVISGWSTAFGGPQPLVAEKLIERRFRLQNQSELRVWEETGENIARHIWDAALAAVMCLQRAIIDTGAMAMPHLQERLRGRGHRMLRVVELGSGCGIVGIALAEMMPRCSVTLTDLPEVHDIVTRNIKVAHPAPGSTIDFRVLDWDQQPGEDVYSQPIDLILVSDCTYNADSLPSLVRMIDTLVRPSSNALVLVALKRRHDSEAVFFDLMQDAAFSSLERDTISLPCPYAEEEEDLQGETIEIYIFGRNESA